MEHKNRDNSIRQKILEEIKDIESFTEGLSEETMKKDKMLQKAIVMSLINIGELSKAFSEEYLKTMPSIPWKIRRCSLAPRMLCRSNWARKCSPCKWRC